MLNRSYIPGLDGLRAFAILFVTFYHFSFSWARGGFLGVNIFFVLSGYLITSKILSSGRSFKVKTFWKGRLRRLFPPACLMILVTVLLVLFFNQNLLKNLLGDTISSISYTTNWWFIFHKLSYFDSFGSPSPFKHIWFLAVQEQFYVLWPFILLIGLKITRKTTKLARINFVCALLSAGLMGILYDPNVDPSRVYYGTDTRAFELLIGSFLATLLVNKKPLNRESSSKSSVPLNIISIISFAIFIYSAIFIDEFNIFLYRGGLFLFSLNTALLIACISNPKGILGSILSWKPLRWIGTRSYGIYLWHYPIMVLSTPVYEIGHPSYLRVFFQLAITCILAEFSYRFIESPIRKSGSEESSSTIQYNIERKPLPLIKRISPIISFMIIMAFTVGIIAVGKMNSNAQKADASSSDTVKTEVAEKPATETTNTSSSTENAKKDTTNTNNEDASKKATTVTSDENSKASSSQAKAYKGILAIGDSVMLDIKPYLGKKYTNITIDGKVGRQMWQAISLTPNYASFNDPDKAVIIELGTNGFFTNKQIDQMLDSFSKAHVFLVNTRVPRSWESNVNKLLKQKSEERENVTLIDWYSLAAQNHQFFEPDGVHLKPKGSEALTNLITESLK